jgi:Flp pilus assembly protein TadG
MPLRSILQARHGATRGLRRFARDGEGATAVEFALVATMFVPVLCAIIETALVFWAGQILDTSLANATRGLYTGSFQGKNQDTSSSAKQQQVLTNLRNLMCYPSGDTKQTPLTTIYNCNDVKIDVQSADQFGGASAGNPVDSKSGNWAEGFGTRYTTPQPGQIAIVQAAVKFPSFFAFLKPKQASFGDGSTLLRSTVAFRTEPY